MLEAAYTETGRRAEVAETSRLYARASCMPERLIVSCKCERRFGVSCSWNRAILSSSARHWPWRKSTWPWLPEARRQAVVGALVAPLATSQGGAVFILPYGLEKVTENQVIPVNKLTEGAL